MTIDTANVRYRRLIANRHANPYRDFTAKRAEEGLRAATRTPGAGHVYPNFGYQLLGLVLERASGKRYQALLAERLLGPLGMTCSGAGAAGGGTRMTGHSGGKPAGHWDFSLPGPGAVEATVGDLARYLSACMAPAACSFTTAGPAGSRRPWRSTRPRGTLWVTSESSHSCVKILFRESQSVAKNALRGKSYFSLLNVTGTEYRLRHEQNSNHAGLGSPLPRPARQHRRFGNTVVLFWYDRKAESLRVA